MCDLTLALLFLIVVFSPLAIHAWLNWTKTEVVRYEAEEGAPQMDVGAVLTERA